MPVLGPDSVLGVESVVFGVSDLAENIRFWTDFGLPLESADESEAVFRLQSGSRVLLLRHGDARLPVPDPFAGDGVKETVWGVDTAANLERIAASLASEVVVTRGSDGTVRCVCPD
ncbi:MAG: bleomycin resistance protein, partial [Pseudomonadota bacterium]